MTPCVNVYIELYRLAYVSRKNSFSVSYGMKTTSDMNVETSICRDINAWLYILATKVSSHHLYNKHMACVLWLYKYHDLSHRLVKNDNKWSRKQMPSL